MTNKTPVTTPTPRRPHTGCWERITALEAKLAKAEQEAARLRVALRECTDAAGITYAGWPTDVTEAVAHFASNNHLTVLDAPGSGCSKHAAVLERHGLLAARLASNETPT